MAVSAFSIGRGIGHIVKITLLSLGKQTTWQELAPLSGAVNTITFVIMHDTFDLDLSLFSEQLFGARTTSKGRKLRGEVPVVVPEPTTAVLTGLGLAMLGAAGRRRSPR